MKTDGILDGETILSDDFPVYWDYAYVCDGRVRLSPIKGTVRELKHELNCSEIRRCEIAERMKI